MAVGLVAACVVLVTAGLALASVPNLSGKVNVLLHGTPTATTRIPPGGDLLYVENGLAFPWGQLSINGALVAIDQYRTGDVVSPITLRRGVTSILYRADPFVALHCRISVPASTSDTCPLDARYAFPSVPAGLQNYSPRALDLTPTLEKLPSAARADLLKAVNSSVTVQSSATVQPGERYVNAAHQIVYADQQLTATFAQTLATSASQTSNGCAMVCMPAPTGDANNASPAATTDLVMVAHLTQTFTYTSASGQPVVTGAPISANSTVPSDEVLLLAVTWDGAWHVALNDAPQPNSIACVAGAQALTPYLINPAGNQRYLATTADIAAANPADGCVYRLDGGAYAGPPAAAEYLHIFYRFGVVMVVGNDHDVTWAKNDYLLRGLPVTDDAETALALQIDATQPYS